MTYVNSQRAKVGNIRKPRDGRPWGPTRDIPLRNPPWSLIRRGLPSPGFAGMIIRFI